MSSAPALNTSVGVVELIGAVCDIESVSGNESALADAIEAADSWPTLEVATPPDQAALARLIDARADVRAAQARVEAALSGTRLADALRTAGHAVVLHAGGGSFKSQMKKADGSGAWLALIVGEDEVRAISRRWA